MEQKNFEFFLFENFDASDILTENNPRTYLNHSITGILSDVVNGKRGNPKLFAKVLRNVKNRYFQYEECS